MYTYNNNTNHQNGNDSNGEKSILMQELPTKCLVFS